ncbi:hypothetical protein N7G274_004666 [Stereocaulon virgatum]|uniref:Uncharacterized protein n=1 Tax=Stereocaulon virgatum TaxID=373712 RepID=A0ABR4ADJ4_9LECA
MTVTLLNDEAELPTSEIICTMIRPTTSSSIAAVVRTVPSCVVVKPLVLSTVNVVPKLVDDSAAPAAKAYNSVAFARAKMQNEKGIGKQMPAKGTATDMTKFDLQWKEK